MKAFYCRHYKAFVAPGRVDQCRVAFCVLNFGPKGEAAMDNVECPNLSLVKAPENTKLVLSFCEVFETPIPASPFAPRLSAVEAGPRGQYGNTR